MGSTPTAGSTPRWTDRTAWSAGPKPPPRGRDPRGSRCSLSTGSIHGMERERILPDPRDARRGDGRAGTGHPCKSRRAAPPRSPRRSEAWLARAFAGPRDSRRESAFRRSPPVRVGARSVADRIPPQPTPKGRFPSGQRGQTVNLMAQPSQVRILFSPPPTSAHGLFARPRQGGAPAMSTRDPCPAPPRAQVRARDRRAGRPTAMAGEPPRA